MVNIMSYTVILDQTITWTPARPNRLLENATLLIGRPGDFFLSDPDPLLELGFVLSNFGDENWYRFGREAPWLVTSWTTWDNRKSKLQTIPFRALFCELLECLLLRLKMLKADMHDMPVWWTGCRNHQQSMSPHLFTQICQDSTLYQPRCQEI